MRSSAHGAATEDAAGVAVPEQERARTRRLFDLPSTPSPGTNSRAIQFKAAQAASVGCKQSSSGSQRRQERRAA